METSTKMIGDEGERIARRHLEDLGYKIRETNWRYKRLEIDIIAELPGIIVFVEVKFRATVEFGEPELFVNRKKQASLIAAANEYLLTWDLAFEARFDVVSVTGTSDAPVIRHLEAAFFPVAR